MEGALTAGSRIGPYEVIDRLGAGGMGEVYRARDTRLGRIVAIKVLRSGAEADLLHRLDREARAASALNHPHIVHIYDVGDAASHAGAHYIAMEYVEGETLRRRLARGPLTIHEVLEQGAQIADGLAKAHHAGIVHRDLKPENLMITPDGMLKILDFGLAKLVAAPLEGVEARQTLSRHPTKAGMLVGTLEYMSPEQASGREVDERTDQFSLGLILHEMATGRPAFRRDTPAQVLAAVIERDPEPLRQVRADVPPALEALVTRCLQKDPKHRFTNTDELVAELAALALGSRPRLSASSAAPAPAVSAGPAEVVPPPAPSRIYHVQVEESVRSYDENELVRRIRKRKLSGLELARRDDEEDWQPLAESRIWRRAIPAVMNPIDTARWEAVRGLGAHFILFSVTGAVSYSIVGHIPFWMWIWSVWLGFHTLGSAAASWPVLRGHLPAARPGAPGGGLPGPVEQPLPSVGEGAASVIAHEAARVRTLLEQRGGQDAGKLLADVDGILRLTAEMARRQADLEEQTSDRERAALASALANAQACLERAEQPQDRRLHQRQLDVLRGRGEAIAKALRVLDRLRVRREVAEHQLKQVRLDLSRGAASGLDVPELSSRLQFIRYEVDAKDEVEDVGAGS